MWNIPGFHEISHWSKYLPPTNISCSPECSRSSRQAPAKVSMAPMFPSHEGLPGPLAVFLMDFWREKVGKRARLCQIMPDFWEKSPDNARLCQIFEKKGQIMPDLGSWNGFHLILILMDVLIWMGFHGASMDTSSRKKGKTPMN